MSFDPEYLDEFVRTWLIHRDTDWPDLELYEYCYNDPEKAWELICALADQNLNDSQMGGLGAGFVESLMMRHGARFIDRLELLAASNATFRECLKRSYPLGPNDEIKRRMGIASGVSWVDYSGERPEISPVLIRYNRQWGLRPRYERGRFLGMSVTCEPDDPQLSAFGLTSGDLIVSVNECLLPNPTRAREAFANSADPRALRLGVVRDGREFIVDGSGANTDA